ncbi:hypothetical protein SETIT_5G372300v2 [Setaria italica]|uniref:Uncharacterized protein n=2 Tax=Setaria TaxID=4554 RepID=A0A368RCX8_SETIT|nr:hypothetical protein SETIT_5G372300v2 [Setaria italica]TKW17590.1 hypothetical protein SEVIR_5G377800v2 [Setaria viridis]
MCSQSHLLQIKVLRLSDSCMINGVIRVGTYKGTDKMYVMLWPIISEPGMASFLHVRPFARVTVLMNDNIRVPSYPVP